MAILSSPTASPTFPTGAVAAAPRPSRMERFGEILQLALPAFGLGYSVSRGQVGPFLTGLLQGHLALQEERRRQETAARLLGAEERRQRAEEQRVEDERRRFLGTQANILADNIRQAYSQDPVKWEQAVQAADDVLASVGQEPGAFKRLMPFPDRAFAAALKQEAQKVIDRIRDLNPKVLEQPEQHEVIFNGQRVSLLDLLRFAGQPLTSTGAVVVPEPKRERPTLIQGASGEVVAFDPFGERPPKVLGRVGVRPERPRFNVQRSADRKSLVITDLDTGQVRTIPLPVEVGEDPFQLLRLLGLSPDQLFAPEPLPKSLRDIFPERR